MIGKAVRSIALWCASARDIRDAQEGAQATLVLAKLFERYINGESK